MSKIFSNTPNIVELDVGLALNAYPVTDAPSLIGALQLLRARAPFNMTYSHAFSSLLPRDIKELADKAREESELDVAMNAEVWVPNLSSRVYRDVPEYTVIGGVAVFGLRAGELKVARERTNSSKTIVSAISDQLYGGAYIQMLANPVARA